MCIVRRSGILLCLQETPSNCQCRYAPGSSEEAWIFANIILFVQVIFCDRFAINSRTCPAPRARSCDQVLTHFLFSRLCGRFVRSPNCLSEGRRSIRRVDFKHTARVVSEIFHILQFVCLGKQAGTSLPSDLPELVGLAIRVLAPGVAPYTIHPPINCSSRPLLVSSTSSSAARLPRTVRSAKVADGAVLSFVTANEGTFN